ncbi:acetate--CoA ligase family protein [Arthrobacter sp. zg-Y1219]|uniref:acetate--CoA ligase family protein n=1 Tax=Arthrobacter sp. zg-Y1219 TaxID=3049067 RepID=UPI0024C3EBFA|nr:acetate--CoA ligase family protein [Arthrobacter sp. zg-Y1219]MDK1361085.1 acetate--CoA ligase family protein [Arthrobacter sp. zg-Y1219]
MSGGQSEALRRLLNPRTVAVVGLRDGAPFVKSFSPTLKSDATIYYVNPKHPVVMGQTTVPTLSDIQGPIDAVYCVTSAATAVTVVEEAAALDVGGVVLVSSGYAEMGDVAGTALQERIAAAALASGMAVVGPNGLGYSNVPRNIGLTIAADHKRRAGGLSIVSQSGALLSGVVMAAWDRPQIGLNVVISAGNEAVTDLADYLEYLAHDPATTAIGLVIEKIRRPEAFFEAARGAIRAGKPIVALKLARNSRTQEMAASHTGALTGDAWVYDVAFRQLGIGVARDPEELIDRLAVIDQLGEEYRTSGNGLAVITSTGGYASMAMDLALDEQIAVPALEHLRGWIEDLIPGVHVPNPLDTTPMGMPHLEQILDRYTAAPDVDAVLNVHPLTDEDESPYSGAFLQAFVAAAEKTGKPFLVSNCGGALGDWARKIVDASPAAAGGHGIRATLRGLQTLGDFSRRRPMMAGPRAEAAPVARPEQPTVATPEGSMLPFAAAMELLRSQGIPVAPYHLVAPDAEVSPPDFAGPYVVKLADVGHRTEHGAVEVGVPADELRAAVTRMRSIARRDALPALVVVQPMLAVRAEAFIGIQSTELGPMVVFGLGGVMVEVINRIGGRMAPFPRSEAEDLIAEFEDARLMHGFRGQPAWELNALADLLVRVGDFAAGSSEWLGSLDINPLVVTDDGFAAVDALCLLQAPPAPAPEPSPVSESSVPERTSI